MALRVLDAADLEPFLAGAAAVELTEDGLAPWRIRPELLPYIHDEALLTCLRQPSGVRLEFRTDAKRFELQVGVITDRWPGREVRPIEPFDIYVGGDLLSHAFPTEVAYRDVDPITWQTHSQPIPTATLSADLGPGIHDVVIWLPYRDVTYLRGLTLFSGDDAASQITPITAEAPIRWVHYGSSISHGANAATPSQTWVATAARSLGWELTNFGLSGNALLDPVLADAIGQTPADLITLKIGINVVNGDHFTSRTFVPMLHGFLDRIRHHQPATPIVLISPIACPLVEEACGPTLLDPDAPEPTFITLGQPVQEGDNRLNLQRIRTLIAEVASRRVNSAPWRDGALSVVNGLDLYGLADCQSLPMADLLHPDAAAQILMGQRFAARAPGLLRR